MPQLSLPAYLRTQGYRTYALVSMPVLNQTTNLNNHFDRYQLMKEHNNFAAMVAELEFDKEQPSFYLMNTGETHYPYTLPGEGNNLPRIHGVHGVFKHMDDALTAQTGGETAQDQWFDANQMRELQLKQQRNVEYLDSIFELR